MGGDNNKGRLLEHKNATKWNENEKKIENVGENKVPQSVTLLCHFCHGRVVKASGSGRDVGAYWETKNKRERAVAGEPPCNGGLCHRNRDGTGRRGKERKQRKWRERDMSGRCWETRATTGGGESGSREVEVVEMRSRENEMRNRKRGVRGLILQSANYQRSKPSEKGLTL